MILALAAALALSPAPDDPSRLASIDPPAGARAPMDAPFLDQSGRSVTLRRLAGGKPLVVIPVQHRCRNLCGLTLESFRAAVSGQPLKPGRDFALVAVGIDPRETPGDAAASAARLGGGQGVSAVVGKPSQVTELTTALGYRYSWMARSGQYAHLSAAAVLAPDGRLVRWMRGLGVRPAQLGAALDDARRSAPFDPGERIRLLCFHYDPVTGRYSLAVLRLLRWAAGASVLVLVLGIGLALRRRRRAR